MKLSRRRLADYVETLHQKACRTCSTIIFLHSTNQINDLWRCRWRCRRQLLNSLLFNFVLYPGYQRFYPNVCRFHDDCPVHSVKSPSNLGRLRTLWCMRSLVLTSRVFVSGCLVTSNFFFQKFGMTATERKTRGTLTLSDQTPWLKEIVIQFPRNWIAWQFFFLYLGKSLDCNR